MGKSYRTLIAWQKAMRLVTEVYKITSAFPRSETYGLALQMRRAAVSVPSNIAEGFGRYSRLECQQFLRTARGSLAELETQILISASLHYVDDRTAETACCDSEEVGRLLNGLLRYVHSQTK